jgi:hypothetical protein
MKGSKARAVLILVAWFGLAGLARAQSKPAILFCSPQGLTGGWIDLEYLRELHERGFEVDYTEAPADVTWERIHRYNALVLYTTPEAMKLETLMGTPNPEGGPAFVALIEKFLQAGGGVLLMPMEQNVRGQYLEELSDRWGARLPLEVIHEADPQKLDKLSHASYDVPLAYTDQVLGSPVSAGVGGIWYPFMPAYNAAMGSSVAVDSNWQVVVKASKTAETQPLDPKSLSFQIPPNILIRPSVKEPSLFAIRKLEAGRVAVVNQWPQFSVGAGVKFIYDRQVLEKGCKGRRSDFGRLLENTYRWLAEPTLASGAVGGYQTREERLVAPNRRAGARQDFEYRWWYQLEATQFARPPKFGPIFRGLVGAKSAYSSGQGSVQEFAAAAKRAGLHFVVFAEDFDKLTPEKFAALKQDCRRFSDDEVTLLPGFAIDANTGDHMFFYSPDGDWPPEEVRTGPGKTLLDLQPQDASGKYTGRNGKSFDWMFRYHAEHGNIGYYNFSSGPHNMRLEDLRMYGAAALRYYRNGKLVEDRTEDYLRCAQGTIPPSPVSFNEVRSPAELEREAASGHSLTYVQARTVRSVFADGLRWPIHSVSYNVFLSDGPIIHDWPETARRRTLGAEEFVTAANLMESALDVSAARGLKEIAIYNGPELFRRFLCHGEQRFRETLLLDAYVHKDLVLIATDQQGGRAVSFARRSWKEGGPAPVFCSDHINDCRSRVLLAHGPMPAFVTWTEPLPTDVAGDTWDGGPPGYLPLVNFQESRPVIESDRGGEDGSRFDQTPLLDFDDEDAVAVATRQDRVFADSIEKVTDPWDTFGPLGGPSKLMEFTLRHWQFPPPAVKLPDVGSIYYGVREGITTCLFRSDIRFKTDMTVKRLRLLKNDLTPNATSVVLLIGRGPLEIEQQLDYGPGGEARKVRLAPGDWFALYSKNLACGHLFLVRAQPLELEITPPGLIVISADIAGRRVQKDDTLRFELLSLGIPMNVEVKSAQAMRRLLEYLEEPQGLEILRGQRLSSPGFVEVAAADGAAEVRVPKPAQRTDLAVPLRVKGLNRRWTAGLWQKSGYVKGDYGSGTNRYRPLGVDEFGYAYVPLYVDHAPETRVEAGHPLVADGNGKELFIQVTHVWDNPDQWHVSVNNPTDRTVRTRLHKAMDLPGLVFPDTVVELKPGAYEVLR